MWAVVPEDVDQGTQIVLHNRKLQAQIAGRSWTRRGMVCRVVIKPTGEWNEPSGAADPEAKPRRKWWSMLEDIWLP